MWNSTCWKHVTCEISHGKNMSHVIFTFDISHVKNMWNFTCEISHVKFHMWNFTCEISQVKFHMWNFTGEEHVTWETHGFWDSHVLLKLHMWITCESHVKYIIIFCKGYISIETEFAHVQQWSLNNKLVINTSKTKEIIFWRSKKASSKYNLPLLNNIQCVNQVYF